MSRTKISAWIESKNIQYFITGVIIFNAITLGLETSASLMETYGTLLQTIDKIALAIFVIEILLKLYGRGFGFFKDGWNIFDFIIVGIALVPGIWQPLRLAIFSDFTGSCGSCPLCHRCVPLFRH